MNQRLVAIHGFGGQPSDWDAFDQAFAGWPLHKINLFNKTPLPFAEWARDVGRELASFDGRQVLLAYSLGGRLGAHLLLQDPKLFAAAIFVSVNPGLRSQAEREQRRVQDEIWAQKWRHAPWVELQAEWNAQSVFQSKAAREPARKESDFNREILAQSLDVWSLARQADLRAKLAHAPARQLWMAGRDDQKFVKFAEEMAQGSTQVRSEVISGAGHRVPWDQPSAFVASVASFLESL